MAEVLIPPDIIPQSEDIELVDDGSVLFAPAMGKSVTQSQQHYEPRLRVIQRFRALRGSDKARMQSALRRVQGKFNTLRVQIGRVRRGAIVATELLSNNTFANGTTGWSTAGSGSLTVADRIARVIATAGGGQPQLYQSRALTQYAPHVLRSFIVDGNGTAGLSIPIQIGGGADPNDSGGATRGYRALSEAAYSAASANHFPGYISGNAGYAAGTFFEVPWCSLARCFQIDNGANLLTYSDQFDNAAWTISGLGTASVTANSTVAPDGTTTADSIIEDNATSAHGIAYAGITVASAAADYCIGVAVKSGRPWVSLQILEASGGTALTDYFQLTGAGVVGSGGSTGANWANRRSYITALGDGWYACYLVGRKTNSATSLTVRLFGATVDGSMSYLGTSSASMILWRATLAQSSVPTRLVQTTTTATTGTAQTGPGLYVKGLPASTSGLLTADDVCEINGEPGQLVASLDSDAAGLGYLQLSNTLFRSPADSDPVIVEAPMPKMRLVENAKWTNEFGVQSDLELVMEQFFE